MQKSKAGKRVTIVTVIYNSSAVIEKCLKSIPEDVAVYVVDNASTDNGAELAKQTRPNAKIIKSQTNLGFGRANNLALAKVQTEFALVLNPDTVMNEDTIDNLLIAADKYKDAAIIAPQMHYANGEVQKTYKNSVFVREKSKSSLSPWKRARVRVKNIDKKPSPQPSPIGRGGEPEGDLCAQCLSGAAMLLRLALFKKIGFFDPKIFLFYEDDDICLKARNAGYSLVLTTDAKLIHLMGKSSPTTYKSIYIKNWNLMWSRLYLEDKYNGNNAAINIAIRELVTQLGKSLGHLLMLDADKTVKSIAKVMAIMGFALGIKAVNNN